MLKRDPTVAVAVVPDRNPTGLALFGPAFVAAVAYIDPGNFATNITAGARFGYALIWVIVVANAIAMLVQYLSAKLGVATGHDLAELCREHLPRPVSYGLWAQAEIVAMATDLAEFVGAAIGLNLLFDVPLPAAGGITAIVAFAILALDRRGHRRFELAIAALFGIVFLGFAYDVLLAGVQPSAAQGLVPTFPGSDSVLLAAGIVGATVMPHVIYLHSALTKSRATQANRRELLKAQRIDVTVALGLASLINIAMLVLAAALPRVNSTADPILATHTSLADVIGGSSALMFAVALLASGLSSSSVGTYAGQVVMRGFIRRSIPRYLRRAITMAPAITVLALNLPATGLLILSQVVLSFGIPFALVPLILLTRRPDVMGEFVNRRATTVVAAACAALIIVLNTYLVLEAT